MTELVRPIGIIGAMEAEVNGLVARLENVASEEICGIKFYTGTLYSKAVVIAKCGVGKVFASICATAMAMRYNPRLIVNTCVGGALHPALSCTDTVIAESLVQYYMDTSPLGDPVGLISGINKVYFDTDERAVSILEAAAKELSLKTMRGLIATGDKFVGSKEQRDVILSNFSAVACEMEGGAVAHASYVAGIPFAVIRAISDGANSDSVLDYPAFLKIAVKNSEALTLALIKEY